MRQEFVDKFFNQAFEAYNQKIEEQKMKEHTAGPSIDVWATTYLPPEEWAYGIFEDAIKTATFFPTIVRRYDSPRKVTVPIQTITSSDWVSTIAANVRDAGSTKYDATGKALDPVEYRTTMAIGRKSLEEATWGVAADVRSRLVNAVALKLDTLAWAGLDDSWTDGTKYDVAGESLANCTAGNAVDWDTALTVENIIDCIYNVKNTSYSFFKPTDCQVTASMVKELVKSSTFINAAEFGNRSFLETGEFANFLGLRFHISGNIPQDSGSTDIGLVYDRNYFVIANVPHEFELATNRRYETDEIEWFAKCKGAFNTGDSESGAVLYT